MNRANYLQDVGGYHVLAQPGYLRVKGTDRHAFLQRQTTNQIHLLKPERSLLTVLTSSTARILDVLILTESPEEIAIITLPQRGSTTSSFLKSRIFFNDKVTVEDASFDFTQVDVMGRNAERALQALGVRIPEEINDLADAENGVKLVRLDPAFGLGYRLLMPVEIASDVEGTLQAAGLIKMTGAQAEMLRIEAGLPGETSELTEEYTPLEVGLRYAVSDSKGCYTGQEVIARQVTYDKVTRLLCGLQLDRPAQPGTELIAQTDIPAGRLTSVAQTEHLGIIGLGVVKRPHHLPGTVLGVGAEGVSGVQARVTELPFVKH